MGTIRSQGSEEQTAVTASVLRCTSLFRDVSDDVLAPVARVTHVQTFARGEMLWRPGDPLPCVFILAAGSVRLYRAFENGQEMTTAALGPGQVCGLAGADDAFIATTFAQSQIDGTRVYRILQRHFVPLLTSQPSVALRALAVACQRVQDAYDRMEELALPDVQARVACALAHLAVTNAEQMVWLTQEEVATLARASRGEVTRRVLPELRDRGLIAYERHRRGIHVLDHAGLLAFSLGEM